MRRKLAALAVLAVALAVAPAAVAAPDVTVGGKIKEHYNAKARAAYFGKHQGPFRTADHGTVNYENYTYQYGPTVDVDGLASCSEAIYRSVWANNSSGDIWQHNDNWQTAGSCIAGGENFSQKWTGVILPDGTGWGDCAYDEDPYPTLPNGQSADEWSVDCAFFNTGRDIGAYERAWTSQPQSGSTSITCAEARFTAVGSINNAALYPNAGATSAFTNCSGPHPNASAKFVQLYSNNGAQFFDVLVDRDPTCIGCGTYTTTLYVMELNLHRANRDVNFSIAPISNP